MLLTESMKGNNTPVVVLGDIDDGQHSSTANDLNDQPRYLVSQEFYADSCKRLWVLDGMVVNEDY